MLSSPERLQRFCPPDRSIPLPAPPAMTTSAIETFLSTLRRSNLLTPEQIAATAALASSLDAVSVARELISREWLTEWQARQLLAGKSKLYLGKYKLMDVLGQGGMGAVLKAESTTLRRPVALKVMATNLHDDGIARARFEREIEFSASLNHPNIVRAIDADQIGDRVFLVMEYFAGRDLKAVVKEQKQVSVEFACECIRQAALGLQHAFERGIVHRDIKPSNLLVTKDPKTKQMVIKVLDLGLARIAHQAELTTAGPTDFAAQDGGVTRSGQIMGSPDYMSPEQAMSSSTVDIRSDIYGLGVTLFQLLCNRLPYSGDNVMEKLLERINKDAPPVSAFRPDIPPVLVHIVARMLHRDPAQRFQTPAEVAAVLEAFASDPQSLEAQPAAAALSEQAPDLPTLDAQADETLNAFINDLASEAIEVSERPAAPRPAARHRRKSIRPLAISLGTAFTMITVVLFLLSQGSGPPEKKPPGSATAKASGDDPDPDRNETEKTSRPEPPARQILALPPPAWATQPENPLIAWGRKAARDVRVKTESGQFVVRKDEPLPPTRFSLTGINLAGVQRLSAENLQLLASADSLESLNLAGGQLSDADLKQITRLKTLQFLDLSSTLITDKGVASLGRCSRLTTLRLRYVAVGDTGLRSLIPLASLTSLNLDGTNITDASIETLTKFATLEKLSLKHTAVTEQAVQRLKSTLPDCSIDY